MVTSISTARPISVVSESKHINNRGWLKIIMAKIVFGLSEVLVDKEDVPRIQKERETKWLGRESSGYITLQDKKTKKKTMLHRFVLGLGKFDGNQCVDHINGIRNDNRKANLRVVSKTENSLHKTSTKRGKYRNVHKYRFSEKRGTWNYAVQVQFQRKAYYGGHYETMDEAAVAAEKLRKRLFKHLA